MLSVTSELETCPRIINTVRVLVPVSLRSRLPTAIAIANADSGHNVDTIQSRVFSHAYLPIRRL